MSYTYAACCAADGALRTAEQRRRHLQHVLQRLRTAIKQRIRTAHCQDRLHFQVGLYTWSHNTMHAVHHSIRRCSESH